MGSLAHMAVDPYLVMSGVRRKGEPDISVLNARTREGKFRGYFLGKHDWRVVEAGTSGYQLFENKWAPMKSISSSENQP